MERITTRAWREGGRACDGKESLWQGRNEEECRTIDGGKAASVRIAHFGKEGALSTPREP